MGPSQGPGVLGRGLACGPAFTIHSLVPGQPEGSNGLTMVPGLEFCDHQLQGWSTVGPLFLELSEGVIEALQELEDLRGMEFSSVS